MVFVSFGNTTADSIAAIVVSFVVLYAAYELGRKTINVLVDTAPEGLVDEINQAASSVEGVIGVEKIRARAVGPVVIIDITIYLHRKNNLIMTQEICQKIEDRIRKDFPDSDISIHSKPLPMDSETIVERVQIVAAKQGLSAHNILLHEGSGKKSLYFDLEVSGDLNLEKAHKIASDLEKEIQAEFGNIEVNTHIEPLKIEAIVGKTVSATKEAQINKQILIILKTIPLIIDVHSVSIRENKDRLIISLHCLFDKNSSLDDVHSATSKLEYKIREAIVEVAKVSVHAEPA